MSKHNRNRRATNQLAKASTSPDGRPSFVDHSRLDLREIPPGEANTRRLINARNSYLRAYTLGECSVIVTREDDRWHLSIAHPRRDPTWHEIAEARYRLMPHDCTAAMLLPPMDRYMNVHPHCFQVIELAERIAEAEAS